MIEYHTPFLVFPNFSKNSFSNQPLHNNSSDTPTKKQPIAIFKTAKPSFHVFG